MIRMAAAALALLLSSAATEAATGVAFVHGTSRHTDARNDYWGGDFIDSVRQGLPNPANHVVVNCDFTQYMWDDRAAGCLAAQLDAFIASRGITDLVVITHSNGGNVMRWIMSNPTRDARYPRIIAATRWVNALAPSSAGTPLADAVIAGNAFESALGWLLGYQNDAVRQQQVSWMASYNRDWLYGTSGRPALPRGFWSVVGTDVRAAIWSDNAYCGGYAQTVGLEITKAWLPSCADGFLSCASQEAAGQVWFRDVAATSGGRVLNHNQSRRACFGLDTLLRNDL
ncbi:hypothetical protein [Coralloluteibacterium thermophilus]|uniref:Alpha/beta hydrolase n=1 Tax=Coralloluteibacterium thermophilum TaxID=2707049 RepID=A0ABV9NRY5_9GAMM